MKIKISETTLNKIMIVAILAAVGVAIAFGLWVFRGATITVQRDQSTPSSPITGQPCANAARRPVAVMMSSDAEARPLSGIGAADMVFEMPVTPNGITRMMAIFQCNDPKEIGSIRSARGSFLPLVQGLSPIYAHWGGERDALAQLNSHITDNVDAMLYEGTTYYRKPGIPRPHNGFTTLANIRTKAYELGYSASSSLDPYPHTDAAPKQNISGIVPVITMPWPQNMDVEFRYGPASGSYTRWRGGTPEIDATTSRQVSVRVVIVMHSDAIFLYDQYIAVRTTGTGTAEIYQNGQRIDAQWKKQTATNMLAFVDSKGSQIPLAQGQIWVLVDAPLPQS